MNTPNNQNSPDEQLVEKTESERTPQEATNETQPLEPSSDVSVAAELRKLKSQNEELQDRLLRTQAELENFRRRTMKEAADAMKYQSLPVIRDILPGIDNLQRALDAAEKSGDLQNLVDGIRMVAMQFQDTLKAHSAEAINPEGQPFDPNIHEALTQIPTAGCAPMTVLQVVERGFRIHDRMIRPAKVIVSCTPPESES